jgi:hypothetical protein
MWAISCQGWVTPETASLELSDTRTDNQSDKAPTQPDGAPEAQLPPEAQGEANGGPLGCCLGVTVALLLSLSFAIISHIYSVQLADLLHGWLSFTVKAVMIVFAIAASIALGYAGWKIGRRAFREYDPSPRQLKLAQQQERRLQRTHRRQRHEA